MYVRVHECVCVGASDKEEERVSETKAFPLLFEDTRSVFCITYKNSETESLNYVRGVPAGGHLQQAALILPRGSSLIFPKRDWVSRGVQSAKKTITTALSDLKCAAAQILSLKLLFSVQNDYCRVGVPAFICQKMSIL